MKNSWLAGLLNVLLFGFLTVVILFSLLLILKLFQTKYSDFVLVAITVLSILSVYIGAVLSNWITSLYILRKYLKYDSLWGISFISGFWFTIGSAIVGMISENKLDWIWGELVPIIAGGLALILLGALVNALGLVSANHLFKIKRKLLVKSKRVEVLDDF